METSIKLNPYKIVWAVEIKTNGKFLLQHYPNLDKLKQNHKGSFGSKVYIITDKQFGMMQNTWDGKTPKLLKPFKHSLLIKDGNRQSLVPLTQKQFENPILF